MPHLPEFLGDDLWGCLTVEEEVANDLADDGVSAAIVGFRSGFLALEAGRASLDEGMKQLIKTLSRVAELSGSFFGANAFALAFVKHRQFLRDFIVGKNRQFACGSTEYRFILATDQHMTPPGVKC